MTFFEWFYKVVIIQSVCVLLIILSVLAVKYFFKSEFEKVQAYYNDYVAVDTDIDEVLKDEV